MLNGQVWLPGTAALLPWKGLAFGTLTSVAIGGGGPMKSGGTRNGTPSSTLALNVASNNGPDGNFLGGKDGR